MTTTETTTYRIEDARTPIWFGRWPSGWGEVVHGVAPGEGCSAAAIVFRHATKYLQIGIGATGHSPSLGTPSRSAVDRRVRFAR
jgi:hypothetical protein